MKKSFTFKSESEVITAAISFMEAKAIYRNESVTSPGVSKDIFNLRIGAREEEVFAVLFLDTQHRVIETVEMFHGTIDSCCIYPRTVVKKALELNASRCIFSHNHPGGEVTPSEPDKRLTERLQSALALVDITVLDHIIVSHGKSFSFAESGLL